MVTEKRQTELITYEYPDLGRVEILLQNESADVYRFIKSEKSTGIEYFERLDQLGALRAVHKTAHHSRWEYMVLQMYLVQRLKASGTFGFSTSVTLTKQHTVSSVEELLKSWILLNNYGHLLDTFEAERVWLELVLEGLLPQQTFLNCMPEDQSRSMAAKILEEEDLYGFHHLITLALLRRIGERKQKLKATCSLWIEMVKAMLKAPKAGSKIERALTIFNAIRRASYVLLDMNRSTLFLRIDANNLLRNILENADRFLYDPEDDMNRTLRDMERLLFSEVYANAKSCAFTYEYVMGQKNRFRNIISKTGIDLYCRNYKTLTTQLNQAKISTFGKHRALPRIRHTCRLNLLPDSWFERSECRFYTEQKKLHSDANVNADFIITPTPYPEAGSILDVFTKGQPSAAELSSIYCTLFEYVIECYQGWGERLIGYSAANPLRELFSQILRLYVGSELALRFAQGASPRDYHVDAMKKVKGKPSWIVDFRNDIQESGLTPDRKWELNALLRLLSRQRGELFLIAISNVHLYNPDGTRRVEWDGVFFDVERQNITMYVVEAKRGEARRSDKAKNALLDSLHRAGIRRNRRSLSVVKCEGFAYARIGLKNAIKV